MSGSAYGAAYAGITGGNILEGAAYGGLVWAGGEMVNMAIGHGIGLIWTGEWPKLEKGVFVYDTGTEPIFSIGGTVIGYRRLMENPNPVGAGSQGTIFEHEVSHATGRQSFMGPAYIPLHYLTQRVGGIIGIFTGVGFERGTHRYGVFERWWIELPNYK